MLGLPRGTAGWRRCEVRDLCLKRVVVEDTESCWFRRVVTVPLPEFLDGGVVCFLRSQWRRLWLEKLSSGSLCSRTLTWARVSRRECLFRYKAATIDHFWISRRPVTPRHKTTLLIGGLSLNSSLRLNRAEPHSHSPQSLLPFLPSPTNSSTLTNRQ